MTIQSFVHDVNFFANVTNQTFASTTFGKFFIANYLVAFILGLLALPLLFFNLVFNSPKTLRVFRKILLINACVEVFLWIVFAFGQLRVRTNKGVYLYSFIGPAMAFSFEVQLAASVVYVATNIATMIFMPLPFWFRFRLLKNGYPPSNRSLFCVLFLIFVTLAADISTYTYIILRFYFSDDYATSEYLKDYSSLWYAETPIPCLIIFDSTRSLLSLVLGYFRIFEFLASFLTTFLIAWRSYRVLKNRQTVLSTRSRFLTQFSSLVFVQLCVPVLFLMLPTLLNYLFNYDGIAGESLQQISTILFIHLPWINSTATCILIVPYRNAIIKLLRSCSRPTPS